MARKQLFLLGVLTLASVAGSAIAEAEPILAKLQLPAHKDEPLQDVLNKLSFNAPLPILCAPECAREKFSSDKFENAEEALQQFCEHAKLRRIKREGALYIYRPGAFRKKYRPEPPTSHERRAAKAALDRLSSDEFEERQAAAAELQALSPSIIPMLALAAGVTDNPETAAALVKVLDELELKAIFAEEPAVTEALAAQFAAATESRDFLFQDNTLKECLRKINQAAHTDVHATAAVSERTAKLDLPRIKPEQALRWLLRSVHCKLELVEGNLNVVDVRTHR